MSYTVYKLDTTTQCLEEIRSDDSLRVARAIAQDLECAENEKPLIIATDEFPKYKHLGDFGVVIESVLEVLGPYPTLYLRFVTNPDENAAHAYLEKVRRDANDGTANLFAHAAYYTIDPLANLYGSVVTIKNAPGANIRIGDVAAGSIITNKS